jgi:hypothetical protein
VNKNSVAPERLIFVSHSNADTWIAKQIAREITIRGGTPFLESTDHMYGLSLGPLGDAEFQLWLYCSGSQLRSYRIKRVYRYS